jgi:hypothetical protein
MDLRFPAFFDDDKRGTNLCANMCDNLHVVAQYRKDPKIAERIICQIQAFSPKIPKGDR